MQKAKFLLLSLTVIMVLSGCETLKGVGKDIDMVIGNGYAKGHAETALNILRRSENIRKLYESIYC